MEYSKNREIELVGWSIHTAEAGDKGDIFNSVDQDDEEEKNRHADAGVQE